MLIPYKKTWKNILLQMVILNFRQFILKFLILILWFNDHDLLSIPLVAHHDSNHIILRCKVCAKLHAPQRTQISRCLRALIPLDGTHLNIVLLSEAVCVPHQKEFGEAAGTVGILSFEASLFPPGIRHGW